MEQLLEFYKSARAHGDIGTHVIYHTGTCVRVCYDISHSRDTVIDAANAAIMAVPADFVPIHMKDNFYIVQFVTNEPASHIHCIVGADSLPAAAAIAKDSLKLDREQKNIYAIVWNDGTLDIAE